MSTFFTSIDKTEVKSLEWIDSQFYTVTDASIDQSIEDIYRRFETVGSKSLEVGLRYYLGRTNMSGEGLLKFNDSQLGLQNTTDLAQLALGFCELPAPDRDDPSMTC